MPWQWGCWNASEELKNPSVRIIFPTIERVKNAYNGILPSRYILCFTGENSFSRSCESNISKSIASLIKA